MRRVSPGWWLTLALTAALVALPSVAQQRVVKKELVGWGLLPQTATFAELYFSAPTPLSNAVNAAKEANFTFRVHNVSARRHVYRWQVITAAEGETKIASSSALSLGPGETKAVSVRARIPNCDIRTQVQVQLTEASAQVETIGFWVLPYMPGSPSNAGSAHCNA